MSVTSGPPASQGGPRNRIARNGAMITRGQPFPVRLRAAIAGRAPARPGARRCLPAGACCRQRIEPGLPYSRAPRDVAVARRRLRGLRPACRRRARGRRLQGESCRASPGRRGSVPGAIRRARGRLDKGAGDDQRQLADERDRGIVGLGSTRSARAPQSAARRSTSATSAGMAFGPGSTTQGRSTKRSASAAA